MTDHKKKYKNKYLISLVLPLLLMACNSEEKDSNSTAKTVANTEQSAQLADTAEQKPAQAKPQPQIEQTETAEAKKTQMTEVAPPAGRLTGIIDMGTAKQAVVHTEDQRILYLQTEQQWDGWTVVQIEAQQVLLERAGKQHIISMKTMDAPELSDAAKKRDEVNQRLAQVNQAADEDTENNEATLELSEEEKALVKSRLIPARSE